MVDLFLFDKRNLINGTWAWVWALVWAQAIDKNHQAGIPMNGLELLIGFSPIADLHTKIVTGIELLLSISLFTPIQLHLSLPPKAIHSIKTI